MDKYKKVGKVTIDVSINTVILATQTKWFTQSELNSNYKFTLLRSEKTSYFINFHCKSKARVGERADKGK